MCGIAGILGPQVGPPVAEMTEALHHRGPDCQATIARPNAHVGAARLRVVDLTAGDQPLVSSRTGAVLVFNGEIYNYHALRTQLEARGHRFETATDSEAVLRAYEEHGWRCVEHLRGMYAFAIVDGERAVLARDPFGIKPLYYCWLDGGRTLAFASEIKALLRHPDVPARPNEAALGDLHVFEYIADPRASLFEGIECLEPGRCLELTLSAARLEPRLHTFAAAVEPCDPSLPLDAVERRLDELFDAAMRSHQLADVPICLTLSGGLDSTLVGLLLRQQVGRGVVSYVTGDDPEHVDVQQAAHMASLLGFEHRPILYGFEQYLAAIPAAILASESFVDGVPLYLLFRDMGHNFRVAFNGEGADELFSGYPEHWFAERFVGRIREAPASLPLTERGQRDRERVRAESRLDCDRWMYEQLLGGQLIDRHLHPLDKLSMASSVEVRVPFLDHDLAAYVRSLPAQWRINRQLGSAKYLLRRVYLRRWQAMGGDAGLLDAVLREKRGFPDARRASEQRFHHICERVLPDSYLERHPRRTMLSHKAQALWCDLFEFLFCERRGQPTPDLEVLDFLAARAAQPVSKVAAVAVATAVPRGPSGSN